MISLAEAHPKTDRLAVCRREAAILLGVSERTLWSLTERQQVPHVRIGARVLYPLEQLKAWLAARCHTGPATAS